MQCIKSEREIRNVLSSDQKSLKQLQLLLKKAQKLDNEEQVRNLQAQVKEAEDWYTKYEEIHLSDLKLKQLFQAGPSSQDELKNKFDRVMARKAEIKLKLEEPETRCLNKLQKWINIFMDCRSLLNFCQKCTLPPERMYELEEFIN